MDTIRNYLDNMFAGLPKTRDVLKAKEELLGMMEDKYRELKDSGKTENEAVGIVISEFGNLEELAEALGIKSVLEQKSELPLISFEMAKNYMEDAREAAPKIAAGVFLCIMSPVLLIALLGLAEAEIIGMKEEYATVIGLTVLILMVAAGVSFFLRYSGRLDKYNDLKEMPFRLDYQAELMVRDAKRQDEPAYKAALNISVVAYILSALPIIISALLIEAEWVTILSVSLAITIVALATYNIVKNSGPCEACRVLLQEEDYSAAKKTNKVYKAVSSLYWMLATALYLGYSFITGKWGVSWIIWPIAGVLYGAIQAIAGLAEQRR